VFHRVNRVNRHLIRFFFHTQFRHYGNAQLYIIYNNRMTLKPYVISFAVVVAKYNIHLCHNEYTLCKEERYSHTPLHMVIETKDGIVGKNGVH